MLSPDFLAELCCPKCHGPLAELASPEGLLCGRCALLYPILDGIPNFLIEEARPYRPEGPRP